MRFAAQLCKAFAVALVFALHLPAVAQSGERDARDVGPEDGILCCNGAVPFLFHGDRVLTTTGRAGIFRSEHRGMRWHRSMQGLVAPNGVSPQMVFVCQAPSEPRIVYALAGTEGEVSPFNGLFASEDFGNTWTRRASVRTGFGFARCDVDPDDPLTLYVSNIFDDNPWKSSDGGYSVQRIDVVIPSFVGAAVFPVRGVIYVNTLEALYASTDGGASFQAIQTPPGLVSAFSPAADGHALFFTTIDPATFAPTGTFRSTDAGKSFVAVTGLPEGIGSLAFDPTDRSRIYATGGAGLLNVSTDGGATFDQLPKSNDPRFFGPLRIGEIGVDASGSVYVSTRAGPFRTDDGGQTFRPAHDEFRASGVNDLAFDADGKLLVGVINTRMILRQAQDGAFDAIGHTPVLNANGFRSATAVAGSPTNPNVIIVAGFGGSGIYRTTDGGRSWSVPTVEGGATNYNQARIAFVDASRVYLAVPNTVSLPGLYRSDDAGGTFARLSALPFGAVAAHPTNSDVVYVGTYNSTDGLFKSIDGGQTLQQLGQPGTYSALIVDRRNPQIVYAGEKFGQVIRSVDGGQTFAPASSGLGGAGVHGLAQDAHGTLFAWLRGGGLFKSRDAAITWQAVDIGEALRRSGVEAGRGALVADPRHPGRVYLGNSGVIRIPTGGEQ